MKAEYEDDMRPEYAFSNAVRGKFAGRWTPDQREQIMRESIAGTAWAWHEFALVRVQTLEAALFTLLVWGAGIQLRRPVRPSTRVFDVRPSHSLGQLVQDLRGQSFLTPEFRQRLDELAGDGEWLIHHGAKGGEGDPQERRAHVERLEKIGRAAESLKEEADALIRRKLAESGLTLHEIERKAEETAKLWLAA